MEKRYEYDTSTFDRLLKQTKKDKQYIIISIILFVICLLLRM